MTGQLVMPEIVPGAYWVRVYGHGIIKDGTRFLIVGTWRDTDWLLAWKEGIQPRHVGTLLRPEKVRRE